MKKLLLYLMLAALPALGAKIPLNKIDPGTNAVGSTLVVGDGGQVIAQQDAVQKYTNAILNVPTALRSGLVFADWLDASNSTPSLGDCCPTSTIGSQFLSGYVTNAWVGGGAEKLRTPVFQLSGDAATQGVTIAFWAKQTDSTNGLGLVAAIMTNFAAAQTPQLDVFQSSSFGGLTNLRVFASGGAVTASRFPTGVWMHVAWVFRGTDTLVFHDGLADGSPRPYTNGFSQPTYFEFCQTGTVLNGYGPKTNSLFIDEIALWGRALSTNEVGIAMSNSPLARTQYDVYTNAYPSGADYLVVTNANMSLIVPWRIGAEVFDAGSSRVYRAVSLTTNGWKGTPLN